MVSLVCVLLHFPWGSRCCCAAVTRIQSIWHVQYVIWQVPELFIIDFHRTAPQRSRPVRSYHSKEAKIFTVPTNTVKRRLCHFVPCLRSFICEYSWKIPQFQSIPLRAHLPAVVDFVQLFANSCTLTSCAFNAEDRNQTANGESGTQVVLRGRFRGYLFILDYPSSTNNTITMYTSRWKCPQSSSGG